VVIYVKENLLVELFVLHDFLFNSGSSRHGLCARA